MAGRDRASAGKGFETSATCLLRELTGNPAASFHDGQLEAIRELVVNRNRALVVQRTGWGKSAVYFIATRLLRDQGSGPTLLVSPLLALMRNQIEAARRMNVRAETINSDNQADWPQVVERIRANEVDLLLISPERLANRRFLEDVLDHVGQQAGLVVVDEAHCISDWGHDFRPDYRRIERVLELLPPGVPVLACTATANDRVVDDVVRQLGDRLTVFRGPLARAGLALQVITLDAPAARLAWLSTVIPTLDGSGIVYCLTVRDAETVPAWLRANGIDAVSYTGGTEHRPDLERALLANGVKVIVATSALGMGFDKPDLSFVIHYQSPGSVIHYYQQVGRAGRQLVASHGVLLRGRRTPRSRTGSSTWPSPPPTRRGRSSTRSTGATASCASPRSRRRSTSGAPGWSTSSRTWRSIASSSPTGSAISGPHCRTRSTPTGSRRSPPCDGPSSSR